MGIFNSIKKAIGFGSSESKETISHLDDNCACGGNCTCGQAEVKETPKAATTKTVLPNGTLKEEEEAKPKAKAKKPTAKKATAKATAKPKAKKASNRAKAAKKG